MSASSGAEAVGFARHASKRLLLGALAQRDAHPGRQLGWIDRLAEVVVGSQLQAGGYVGAAGPGGQEEHRDVGQVDVGFHGRQGRRAVHHRHVDVEQHEIGGVGTAGGERGLPVGRLGHAVARALQGALQDAANGSRVVDHEHGRRRHSIGSTPVRDAVHLPAGSACPDCWSSVTRSG